MNKKSILLLLLTISVIFFSCSKSSQPNPGPKGDGTTDSSIKIEIVSGDNQTDTIGRPLVSPINVKLTKNGQPLANYKVGYQGSGCNSDHTDITYTSADGTVKCYWSLAGDIGQQTLKIYAMDNSNTKLDSITAHSTGIAPGNGGWHYSACTVPAGFTVSPFCKLSNGRLFNAVIDEKTWLRYSDDNGASWNAVKALGNTHQFALIASSTTDELYAIANDGNYYSTDQGNTWTNLPVQAFNSQLLSGLIFTPNGNIFVSTRFNGLYISTDKGKTWTAVPLSAIKESASGSGVDGDLAYPFGDKDGNFYILGLEGQTIHKSSDGGKTWAQVFPAGNLLVTSICIDPTTNWIYATVQTSGIYVSKDEGVTFSLVINYNLGFVENLSVQSDGNLYFSTTSYIYGSIGATSPLKQVTEAGPIPSNCIVAKNNNLVVNNFWLGTIGYRN
ncbi:MAG TPA: sialidase family protein [Mucilaginibacter sp.]